jgi:uncharacterized protein (DUF58 family)
MSRFGGAKCTKTGMIPRFAMLGIIGLVFLTGNNWLMLTACMAAGLNIAPYLVRPRLQDLAVTVEMPQRVVTGQSVTTVVRVTNTGTGWSPLSHLVHVIDGFGKQEIRVEPLPPGESVAVQLERICEKRGVVTRSLAVLITEEPLGLLKRGRHFDVPLNLIAHPREVPVQVPEPRGGNVDNREWVVDRAGTDVHGIREWRTGDEANQVHWRSTARRGRLVVLEREVPKAGRVAIVLSAGAGDESWESVVSVAGWTAVATERTGREVALIAQHGGLQMISGGPTELLDWCAILGGGALAGEAELERACAFVGAGGDVLVACGSAVPAGWWDWASGVANRRGTMLQLLEAPAVQ